LKIESCWSVDKVVDVVMAEWMEEEEWSKEAKVWGQL
jgi:hypothetical protein